jgi:hypothetical protein
VHPPGQESTIAFGMAFAREAESAGAMGKVPKGRRFAGLTCSDFIFVIQGIGRVLGMRAHDDAASSKS